MDNVTKSIHDALTAICSHPHTVDDPIFLPIGKESMRELKKKYRDKCYACKIRKTCDDVKFLKRITSGEC